MSKIIDVTTEYYRIPLPELMEDAKHGLHTHFEVPIVKITTEDGREGVGYTYTGGFGGRAICSLIAIELRNILLGKDASCVEALWDQMNWGIHYVARGGLASFAIAACDIALWDLRTKKANEPLYKLLGGTSNKVKCYGGAIDLNFPLEKLLANNQKYLDMGLNAVKIKLGQQTLEEDIQRIAAVRELIGPDVTFMVDANMSWSVEKAIRAAKAMAPYNILFLEEPTIPEDYEGYARIAEEGHIAVAGGENLRTLTEFHHLLKYGHVDFPQPDASNVGGITGWLKVAYLAQANNLAVSTHGMQELHVSLLAAMPNAGYLEMHSFPIDQYTTRPLVIDKNDGMAVAPEEIGIGVTFDWDKLAPHKLPF
ncbi:mandelate racemase/muconate lactonizing enzyme family protein [Enterococcus sp. BWR-S5]|uniref:mandelate racemase/muconate lactonizing enzyme family protein n=1 Tax=Enterococcus sp. BWR-S5 TaxID=2787714 RepID=UPI0019218BD8|nr:mandelate racemase/muconate lactonizing enzyme family protein [Enterococcus sp. BWR-S5]MBL1225201.1 mandelate racemase/muconate lactonizing enzyme family protein [Enterococcus sp. BWR-S5]